MSVKPVIQRERANLDIDDAVGYYLKGHAEQATLGLIDGLQDAYALLGQHPAIGAPHYGHDLGIPGLRSWSLPRFPYVVFYVEHEGHIDLWRVLHSRRDIPASLREQPE